MAQLFRDIHVSSSVLSSMKLELLRKMEALITFILGEEYYFVDGAMPRHLLEPLLAGILFADCDSDHGSWFQLPWQRPKRVQGQHLGEEATLMSVVEESMLNIGHPLREPAEDFPLLMSRLATKSDIELLFYTEQGRMGVCNSSIDSSRRHGCWLWRTRI
jgi:hypothetical protein